MQKWALILGASSGFGGAISRKLAANGYNIFGVHLDRKATMHNVAEIKADIEAAGAQAVFFNINAADTRARKEAIRVMEETFSATPGTIQVLVHSLAFGTLLPVVYNPGPGGVVHKNQMDMTLDVMAHSLVYWTQDVVGHKLMKEGALLLNLGRGNIVNEDDLAAIIDEKNIIAGLDVLGSEPMKEDNPLKNIKKKENLFITPHLAWGGIESRKKLIDMIVKNIEEFSS